MNKRQHETEKAKLKDERKVLEALKKQYKQAAEDVQGKIHIHNNKIDFILNEYDTLDDDMKSILQSQIYQQKFQKQIKAQLDTIIEKMNDKQYDTIQEYLDDCYVTSFVGTAYDLHGQGIPLILPIDQKSMVDAVTLDPKLSAKLYGTYMEQMKVNVAAEISRGIATAETFDHIARNISNRTNQSFNNTMRIVRTEGHGVQIRAAVNMQERAKKAGADVLKQWDATLDARTRDSHARLDGEIRELDEKFSNGMKYPSDPSGGASEVINCRCALLQRARWALDDEELEVLKQRAEYFGLDKTDNFNDFKKKYLKGAETASIGIPKPVKAFTPAKTIEEAEEYARQFVKEKTWSGDGNVSYKGLSLESANKLNETLKNLYDNNDIPPLRNIQPMNFREKLWKGSEKVPMAYRSLGDGDLFFNPKIMKDAKALEKYMEEGRKAYKICMENLDKFTGSDRKMVETYLKAGKSLIAEDVDDAMKAIIEHEMGHHIQHNIIYKNPDMVEIVKKGYEKYGVKISGYATKTDGEYIAESYAAFCNGKSDIIDPKLKSIFETIRIGSGTVDGNGKKSLANTGEISKIEVDEIIVNFIDNPKTLGDTSPKEKYDNFVEQGADVKPLNKGSLKNIPYEDGGGYKVNGNEDGRYFQYHPDTKSHHNGEYYKVSSGKTGVKRYDMEGNLIED